MGDDWVIRTQNLGKCYQVYDRPVDRLKQSLYRRRRRFYREFWALRDVSLTIERGTTVGIIGSNGSGKSTLLEIISGTLTPNEGVVEVRGRVSALLELGAGFNPEFSGRENVYLNAAIMGRSLAEIEERYADIAAFADIGPFIDQPVKTYSSGMYVRLAFAAAIHVAPEIFVVDEALAVGDARFQQKCMARIRDFCRTGTVLLVSHDMAAVTELCTRAIWMDKGQVRMDGRPKFVVEKYLQYMYEGDREVSAVGSAGSCGGGAGADLAGFHPLEAGLRQFGNGKVSIEAVRLVARGALNRVAFAGQACEVGLLLHCREDVARPIAGFVVKDRLGRELLADNTALMKQPLPGLKAGGRYVLTFRVASWPNLREEPYALCVAVAEGELLEHEQCHYVYDALIFTSVPVRNPGAIFSVPDTEVHCEEVQA